MEVSAKLRYARITPRKMRLVARLCQGLSVPEAKNQIRFNAKRGSRLLSTLLDSAVANAREKGGIDMENLYIKQVMVDPGPVIKRFLPRSMGRATPLLKRMSHITIVLDEAR